MRTIIYFCRFSSKWTCRSDASGLTLFVIHTAFFDTLMGSKIDLLSLFYASMVKSWGVRIRKINTIATSIYESVVDFPNPHNEKHAYSNILKIWPPKKWKFLDKNSDVFHISAQNIDCGYSLEPPHRGGSNGEAVLTSTTIYVLSRNK